MKFSKKITFESSEIIRQNLESNASPNNYNKHNYLREHLKLQPPLSGKSGPKLAGQAGLFCQLKNDFTLCGDDDEDDDDNANRAIGQYVEHPEWTVSEREDAKRVRFVICILALLGLAFALMSRLILNVSIVEMVKGKQIIIMHDDSAELDHHSNQPIEQIFATTPPAINVSNQQLLDELQSLQSPSMQFNETTVDHQSAATTPPSDLVVPHHEQDQEDDGLHFDWSKRQVNMILGSFYLGYMPGILFSGGIAQRYGAKYPLLVCVFGTSIINILTPSIARISLELLIASRISLGLIQGSLFPALYELFNRWLTQTESSIFAPMIKVSMPLGSVIGTLMPGLLASFGLEWPYLFYIGGGLCLAWSSVWLYFATSSPQTNKYVSETELKRIMRKKLLGQQQQVSVVVDSSDKHNNSRQIKHQSVSSSPKTISANKKNSNSTPWRLIILNPSVLALTVVKYTYNIGMDFIYLELAVYLREAHSASIESISMIASCCYCMQMFLITFVGWLAKTVVTRRVFNFSVTKWRKTFQGGSNFCMALIYVILALTNPSLELSSLLIILVCFFWMLGAGGESMVPYDLSSKYPASIVGFAHSVSILSGVSVPVVFDLVLGEETKDPERWRLLFLLVAGALTVGGLVFVLVLKAKPFLPEEKMLASQRAQRTNTGDDSTAATQANQATTTNGGPALMTSKPMRYQTQRSPSR